MKTILENQKKINFKKGIIGPVISVFVMVLIISILAGLTFLFVAQLKAEVLTTSATSGGVNSTAYQAVNDTEAAGATVVNYLSLIFLAVIFGAILTLVLRIILPYINLGQSMGGF